MNLIDEYKRILLNIKRPGIDNLVSWLLNSDFFTAPASTKYHNNFEGGLALHSYKVMKIFNKLNEVFNSGIDVESIKICGLLHDVCKANFYITEQRNRKVDGQWETYDCYTIEDQEPLGHGAKSIIILNRFISLTEFEVYSILWHMGIPTDFADRMSYSKALEKHPNIILLQSADSISTSLFEIIKK